MVDRVSARLDNLEIKARGLIVADKRELTDYTDRRKFRNDLDKFLNAGCALKVISIPENGIRQIVLLGTDDIDQLAK